MVDKAARYIPITLNKNHNDSRTKKVVNAHENCRSRIKTFKIIISKIDQGKSKNGTSAQGSPFSLLHDYATRLSVLNMLHMIVSLQHINNYTVILYNATFVLKLSPKGTWLLYVPTAPLSFFPSRVEFLMQKRPPLLQFPALCWLNNPFHLFFIRLTPLTGAVILLHCEVECWGTGCRM